MAEKEKIALPIVLESSVILDAFCSIRKDRLLYPNRHEEDYFVLTTAAESVAIIALSEAGEILVTREYRHPVGNSVFSCPGGLIDPHESVLEAAHRELKEETGYKAKNIEIIGSCFPLPGILNQKMHIALATGIEYAHTQQLEPTENIQLFFMQKEDLFNTLHHEHNIDGIFCTALFFYTQLITS